MERSINKYSGMIRKFDVLIGGMKRAVIFKLGIDRGHGRQQVLGLNKLSSWSGFAFIFGRQVFLSSDQH